MIKKLIIFLIFLTNVIVNAQANRLSDTMYLVSQDSTVSYIISQAENKMDFSQNTIRSTNFNAKQLILPGCLIALGTIGTYSNPLKRETIRDYMDDLRGKRYFRADDYIQYLPAVTYLTFGSIGIKSKHSFKERLAVGVTSYLVMTALVNIGKYTIKEKRPDSNSRNSFPSGHTATVFTGAELMREEYGLGMGLGAYTVAVGVAFLRIYNGRHWINDVIAGAGIGILSARIGYWMLPLYQRWFKWDDSCSNIMAISPSYSPIDKSFAINMAYNF
ncbi:MAG: phosphatase PAP2 family protein [Muribaculaceae bacterium]|nr:phosphatase PAP2 family protein [Muribaculaceae bacterium]